MCNKSHMTKRFFVLLHQPYPLQKALFLGVVKENPISKDVFENTRNSLFLSSKEIHSLGYQPPVMPGTYLVPIEIPREWFLH